MTVSVEQCSVITSNTLQKNIRKDINKKWPQATRDEIFNRTQEELDKFTVHDQKFKFMWVPNQFGGFRWFFLCERCNGKALKLFLPPKEAYEYEHKYFCKRCHKLKNESLIRCNNGLYKHVLRPLYRMKAIEKKLEVGHLRPEKTRELLDEYEAIENEMKQSPEYRLYVFKKKRGLTI
jgi:superfamily II helicase